MKLMAAICSDGLWPLGLANERREVAQAVSSGVRMTRCASPCKRIGGLEQQQLSGNRSLGTAAKS